MSTLASTGGPKELPKQIESSYVPMLPNKELYPFDPLLFINYYIKYWSHATDHETPLEWY